MSPKTERRTARPRTSPADSPEADRKGPSAPLSCLLACAALLLLCGLLLSTPPRSYGLLEGTPSRS